MGSANQLQSIAYPLTQLRYCRSDGSVARVHPTSSLYTDLCRINLANARTIRPTILMISKFEIRNSKFEITSLRPGP